MQRAKHTCWSCGAVFVDVGRVPLSCPRCGTIPQTPPPAFPRALMQKVPWSFTEKAPPELAAFRAAVVAYNKDLAESAGASASASEGDGEVPKRVLPEPLFDVVLPTWRVRVVFTYRGDDADALVSQKEPVTALSLLHQVHRAWGSKLARQDHHFFEGFSLLRGPRGTEPPSYSMRLGS